MWGQGGGIHGHPVFFCHGSCGVKRRGRVSVCFVCIWYIYIAFTMCACWAIVFKTNRMPEMHQAEVYTRAPAHSNLPTMRTGPTECKRITRNSGRFPIPPLHNAHSYCVYTYLPLNRRFCRQSFTRRGAADTTNHSTPEANHTSSVGNLRVSFPIAISQPGRVHEYESINTMDRQIFLQIPHQRLPKHGHETHFSWGISARKVSI